MPWFIPLIAAAVSLISKGVKEATLDSPVTDEVSRSTELMAKLSAITGVQPTPQASNSPPNGNTVLLVLMGLVALFLIFKQK